MATSARKIVCEALSTNFRECTKIVTQSFAATPKPGHTYIRNIFCGINASDINFTAGIYQPGVQPPFDTGFEAIGRIAAVGAGVDKFKVGDPVAYTTYGAFAEQAQVDARTLVPLPRLMPEALTLPVSGLTASIALEKVGEVKKGDTVLVTAAAGATGSFAVQIAKQMGAHVIGTASSKEKCDMLKKLGCDRPVNYKEEDLFTVLKAEYPNGVDVVYESVGGKLFDASVNNLAVKGRLVVIGFMSGYQDGTGWTGTGKPQKPLPPKLLSKSASVRGFFLNNYAEEWKPHFKKLAMSLADGSLQGVVDPTKFEGLEGVADAIEYMYAGKNVGKVVVRIQADEQSKL